MNQQGTISGSNCGSSQNGRGGTFYVVTNQQLADSLTSLLAGNAAAEQRLLQSNRLNSYRNAFVA